MFYVVQFSSGFKIDIYVLGNRPYELEEFRRRIPHREMGRTLWLATPEDLILSKLDWFRLGGECSERHWRDVIGLLQIHGPSLDLAYIEHWVAQLGLAGLWLKAQGQIP